MRNQKHCQFHINDYRLNTAISCRFHTVSTLNYYSIHQAALLYNCFLTEVILVTWCYFRVGSVIFIRLLRVLRFNMRSTCALLVFVLCIASVERSDARAQAQQVPQNYPNFPAGQGGFPQGFPGGMDSFPGFPAGSQGGFPNLPGPFSVSQYNSAQLEQLKTLCIANGGQQAYNDLEKAVGDMQKCIMEFMPRIQDAPDKTPGGICKFMQTTLHKCLTDFTSKLEHCLDKNTAYSAGFSIEVFDSIFKFLCKDNAKHITTLMTSIAQPNNKCFTNLQEDAKSCLSNTKHLQIDPQSQSTAYNISRKELCSDTKILTDCISQRAKNYCTGELNEFVTGISYAVYEPCAACKVYITNTFVLIALLFLSKLF